MFGELTAEETISHLIVTSKMNECIFSIPSPFDEDKSIDLYFNLDKNTKNKVKIVDGAPYISVEAKLTARILSATNNSNYFKKDDLELIEAYASSYVKDKLKNYLYKTSKEFKSDIALFGKAAVYNFSTWDKWAEYNWLDNYANAFFNVEVDVDVASSYLIS